MSTAFWIWVVDWPATTGAAMGGAIGMGGWRWEEKWQKYPQTTFSISNARTVWPMERRTMQPADQQFHSPSSDSSAQCGD